MRWSAVSIRWVTKSGWPTTAACEECISLICAGAGLGPYRMAVNGQVADVVVPAGGVRGGPLHQDDGWLGPRGGRAADSLRCGRNHGKGQREQSGDRVPSRKRCRRKLVTLLRSVMCLMVSCPGEDGRSCPAQSLGAYEAGCVLRTKYFCRHRDSMWPVVSSRPHRWRLPAPTRPGPEPSEGTPTQLPGALGSRSRRGPHDLVTGRGPKQQSTAFPLRGRMFTS